MTTYRWWDGYFSKPSQLRKCLHFQTADWDLHWITREWERKTFRWIGAGKQRGDDCKEKDNNHRLSFTEFLLILLYPFLFKCRFYNVLCCSTYYLQAKWLQKCFFMQVTTWMIFFPSFPYCFFFFGHASVRSNDLSAPMNFLLIPWCVLYPTCFSGATVQLAICSLFFFSAYESLWN